ncbi:MAG: GTPase [Candidatus Brocadiales bacterium]
MRSITVLSVMSFVVCLGACAPAAEEPVEEVVTTEADVEAIRETLHDYSYRSDKGKVPRGGIRTVFFGPPNAGKSSLFNALMGWPRAITSHESGTTRDYVEGELILDGISFRLLDTAGLVQINAQGHRKPDLETLTIDMTAKAIGTSSLSICVIDGSRPIEKSSFDFLQSFHQSSSSVDCILVINKTDLPLKFSIGDLPLPWQNFSRVYTSTITGGGIEELKREMAGKIIRGGVDCSASPALLNTRQRTLLEACLGSLEQAAMSLKEDASPEFVALDVRDASDTLGELLGEITTEDILEKIFSQFCIGK